MSLKRIFFYFDILLFTLICCFVSFFYRFFGSYLCYSSPVAINHKSANFNYSYIGLVDNFGNIKVIVIDNLNGRTRTKTISPHFEKDEHAHPVLLVLPDNRVMVVYSKHYQQNSFYYKIASAGFKDISAEKTASISSLDTFTYPNLFLSDNDSLLVLYRGFNQQPSVSEFTLPDENFDIKEIKSRRIVQSTGERPYAIYFQSDNKIYMAYTTGHADVELPNFVYLSVIDTKNMHLFDIDGNLLADLNIAPYKISKDLKSMPQSVVVDSTFDSRNTVWDLTLDKNNSPMIAFVKISPDKQQHSYYLAKRKNGKWIQNKIADGISYFHNRKGVEETFSAGLSIDKNNPDIVYISVPVKGISIIRKKHEIFKLTLDDNLNVLSSSAVTKNSFFNNIRPITIKDSDKLIYLFGKYDFWKKIRKNIGFELIVRIIKKP